VTQEATQEAAKESDPELIADIYHGTDQAPFNNTGPGSGKELYQESLFPVT